MDLRRSFKQLNDSTPRQDGWPFSKKYIFTSVHDPLDFSHERVAGKARLDNTCGPVSVKTTLPLVVRVETRLGGAEREREKLGNMPRANIIGRHPLTGEPLTTKRRWCTSPTLVRSRASFRDLHRAPVRVISRKTVSTGSSIPLRPIPPRRDLLHPLICDRS